MAVVKMKRAYLIGYRSLKPKIINALQEKGILHITNLRENITETDLEAVLSDHETDTKELEFKLSQVDFALNFLKKFEEKEKGFLSGLIKEKLDINKKKYDEIEEKIKLKGVYKKCDDLDTELISVQNEENQLNVLEETLSPWKSLDIKLKDLGESKRTKTLIGEVPASNLAILTKELEKNHPDTLLKVIKSDSRTAFICLVFMIDQNDEVSSVLHKQGFRQTAFDEVNRIPKEEIKELEKQRKELGKKRKSVLKKIVKEIHNIPNLLILQDYLQNKLQKEKVVDNFAETEQAFMVEGWVKISDTDKLVKDLAEISKEVSVKFANPAPGEEPPIVLKNRNWLKPFEIVTKLYGTPQYKELDPTPYMAPFFLVFFGLCIGDVGYGAVLILVCWYLRKKLPVSKTAKDFMLLLIYGGFAAMIAGALTGSWFAIETAKLPAALQSIIILEPLEQPVIFLVFAIILGLIQLWFGVLLELIDNLRQGKIGDAFLKQGAQLILLPSMALLITVFLSGGGDGAPIWLPIAQWMAIIGALMVILFHNRESKNWLARIGGGLYGLYGMSSFLGDTISYARLMALGLATFLIGWAFNLIGGLVFSGIFSLRGSVPGIIAMVILFAVFSVVFVGLHLFNLAISSISAFVHPARLQYVEFFSKFFDGGGKKYEPFSLETKNLNIK